MAADSILFTTTVIIEGYNNSQPVVFFNLMLNEALISVNHFSFSVRADDHEVSFDSIINFKKKVLGNNVQIELKDGDNTCHLFKGIILEVSSSLTDAHHYEFHISGSGLFCKTNKIAECHSFYKKSQKDIINAAFQNQDIKSGVVNEPQNSNPLHYIVQYNQSLFNFIASLAIRFGEWMYYDGEKLQYGKKPETNAEELQYPGDVYNLNSHAQVVKNPAGAVSTDIFKGSIIQSSREEQTPDDPMIQAVASAAGQVYENAGGIFMPSGFNQDNMDNMYRLEQLAGFAAAASIAGSSRNNRLKIGKPIIIKDKQDAGGKRFIITQIQHSIIQSNTYSNSFTAVPIEIPVPPYTNPRFLPKAASQVAVVTDNEDDAGIARVKVKFPWMHDEEKTPWISVMVPHAGKEKGFRFLPEKDDEVMVDFAGGNAESPYVIGAVYTDKNKPDIPENGNHVKIIGTKTGRRLEFDDDKGIIRLYDNIDKDPPINGIMLQRSKDAQTILIASAKTKEDYSSINMKNGDGMIISGFQGGKEVIQINLDIQKKKITIKSEGSIDIHAKNGLNMSASEINMNAANINVKASDTLTMEGKKSIEATGMDIKIEANMSLDMSGKTEAKLKGAQLDLKGDAMASLNGTLVKIN